MIRVFDSALTFIGEVDDFKSVIITRKYRGIETIEITIPYSSNNASLLQKKNWVCAAENKMFKILVRSISGQPLVIKIIGYSVAKILDRRLRYLNGVTDQTLFKSYTAGSPTSLKLSNKLANSKFSAGLSSWISVRLINISTANGMITYKAESANTILLSQDINATQWVAGHTYYIRCCTNHSQVSRMDLREYNFGSYDEQKYMYYNSSQPSGVNSASTIYTATKNGARLSVYHGLTNYLTDVFSVGYFLLIDLTEVFGDENIPTKTLMDLWAFQFRDSWFSQGNPQTWRQPYSEMVRNVIRNGNFKDGSLYWLSSIGTTVSVENNELSLLATEQYGKVYQDISGDITKYKGSTCWFGAWVKSTNNQIAIALNDGIGQKLIYSTKIGEYEFLSGYYTVSTAATRLWFALYDRNASGWSIQYLQKAIVINLTADFAIKTLPSLEHMNLWVSQFTDNWFDFSERQTFAMHYQNLAENGNFESTVAWTVSHGSITASNNILKSVLVGDATYGGMYNTLRFYPLIGYTYLLKVTFKVDSAVCTSCRIYLGSATARVLINTPDADVWYTKTLLVTADDVLPSANRIYIYHVYPDKATAVGKIMEIKELSLINVFGEFGPEKTYSSPLFVSIMAQRAWSIGSLYDTQYNWRDIIVKKEIELALLSYGNNISYLRVAAEKTYGSIAENNFKMVDILLRFCEDILKIDDLGYCFIFDPSTKTITFDTYVGVDRTVSNGIVSPIIFSPEMDNVLEREYFENLAEEINHVTAFGAAEIVPRPIGMAGSAVDDDRLASFSDERGEISSLSLSKKAENSLVEPIVSYSASINPEANLIYEKDYNIGDIVTIRDLELGVIMDARIIEIKETYEAGNNRKLDLIFGNDVPTILNSIRKIERSTIRTRTNT